MWWTRNLQEALGYPLHLDYLIDLLPFFIDEETEVLRLRNWPKVTPFASDISFPCFSFCKFLFLKVLSNFSF
jgi:hypothetical protein